MKPVLYVDDDDNDAFFMCHAWEVSGIDTPVIHLKDGQTAIDYLAGHGPYADREKHPLPCLLLLDLKMPRKSGFDVLDWIRQHPEMGCFRIVIVSGSDQKADVEHARGLGAIDYIVKSPILNVLTHILRERKDYWFSGCPK